MEFTGYIHLSGVIQIILKIHMIVRKPLKNNIMRSSMINTSNLWKILLRKLSSFFYKIITRKLMILGNFTNLPLTRHKLYTDYLKINFILKILLHTWTMKMKNMIYLLIIKLKNHWIPNYQIQRILICFE